MKRASSLYIKRSGIQTGQSRFELFDTEPVNKHKRTPSGSSKSTTGRGQDCEEVFDFGSFLDQTQSQTKSNGVTQSKSNSTPPKLERAHSSPFVEHVYPSPRLSTPSSAATKGRTRRRLRRRRATTDQFYGEEKRWQPTQSTGQPVLGASPDLDSSFESMQSSFSNFSGKTPSPVSCSIAKKFSVAQQRNEVENLQLDNLSPTSRLPMFLRQKSKSPMKLVPSSQAVNRPRLHREKSFSLSSQDSLFGMFGDEEEPRRGRSTSFAYGMDTQAMSPSRGRALYGLDQSSINVNPSPRSYDLLGELAELNTLSLKHISNSKQPDATTKSVRGVRNAGLDNPRARRRATANIPLYRKSRAGGVPRRKGLEETSVSSVSPAKTCATEVDTEAEEASFVYKFPLWETGIEDRDTEPSQCQPETEFEEGKQKLQHLGCNRVTKVDDRVTLVFPSTTGVEEVKPKADQCRINQPSEDDEAKLERIEALRRKSEAISFMLNERLGGGTFGEVYSAINTNSGELFAVKQIKKSALVNDCGGGPSRELAENLLKKIRDEILLMSELDNPNIARYLGTQWNAETGLLDIFLEYFSNGSIAQMYQKIGGFKENLIRKFTRQIVDGVNYLHGKGIIHRDIKGANVLVTDQGNAKIADFGCSKQLYQAITPSVQASLCKIRGSIPWMAPEVVLQTGNVREAADVWSIGATVIEMATAKHPWPKLQNTVQAILHIAHTKEPPPIPKHLSPSCKDFLNKCLQIKAEARWKSESLAKHDYIEGQ